MCRTLVSSHFFTEVCFCITNINRFQMYDDTPTFIPNSEGHVVPNFPTENITTPIALFYGKKDTLPDMDFMFAHSPKPELVMEVQGMLLLNTLTE